MDDGAMMDLWTIRIMDEDWSHIWVIFWLRLSRIWVTIFIVIDIYLYDRFLYIALRISFIMFLFLLVVRYMPEALLLVCFGSPIGIVDHYIVASWFPEPYHTYIVPAVDDCLRGTIRVTLCIDCIYYCLTIIIVRRYASVDGRTLAFALTRYVDALKVRG